tara:strand:- start:23796 stop:24311 length:516 start_codon:yes stop_codon:yes gene_type:complete
MAKFSKELEGFLNSLGLPSLVTKSEVTQYTQIIPVSISYIEPGDIITFTYDHVPVVAFVVATKRGNGSFTSTKANTLVTSFKLDGSPEVIVKSIVENLYKNSRLSSYKSHWGIRAKSAFSNILKGEIGNALTVARSLKAVLGKDRFRTYNLKKMTQIYRIEIPMISNQDKE